MKKLTCLFLMLLLASTMLNAQETKQLQPTFWVGTRLGMGVSLGKEVFSSMGESMTLLDFPSFYIPIQFGYTFRVEPEFGFYRYNNGDDYTTMLFGCGFFYTRFYWPTFGFYYGGRFNMYRHTGTYTEWSGTAQREVEYEYSRNDFAFSPTIGAECYLCGNKLCLGGEIQFNYMMVGKEKVDGVESDVSPKIMKTKTLFFIRWFFSRGKL